MFMINLFFILEESSSLLLVPWLFRSIFAEHDIERLQLSLTQGFWRTNLWGTQPKQLDVPTGTLLLVKFSNNGKKGER